MTHLNALNDDKDNAYDDEKTDKQYQTHVSNRGEPLVLFEVEHYSRIENSVNF